MFICRENSRRSWILLFPDRPKFCPLTKTRNRRYLWSSGIVGNKLFFPTHPVFLRWLAIIPNKRELKFLPSETSAIIFTDNQSFCICCYKFRAKRLAREFISFNLRVSQSFTSESQNSAVFFFFLGSRADKCWAVKRALRSSFNVWCGVRVARALFPRFRCASRPAKFSFLQTGNPISFCNFRLQC